MTFIGSPPSHAKTLILTQLATEKRTEKAEVIAATCSALTRDGVEAAAAILTRHYPYAPGVVSKRRFRPLDYTRVFIRDGFVDRYTSERLLG